MPHDALRESPIPLVKKSAGQGAPSAHPPPPPRGPGAPPPLPSHGAQDPHSGSLLGTTQRKMEIASAAMRLREEQVSARVVYFAPEAKTNAELDKITASVIDELNAIRVVRHTAVADAPKSPADREIDLTAVLRRSLEQVLDPRRGTFLRVKLDALSRRVTNLYFEAILGMTAQSPDMLQREIQLPEQAVWWAVTRSRQRIVEDLRALRYEKPDVLEGALDRLSRIERDLQMSFLARRAPELEQLLRLLVDVLHDFFQDAFRQNLGDFCWTVIRESAVVRAGDSTLGMPRVGPKGFPRFREAFERQFLEVLLLHVEEPMRVRFEADAADWSYDTVTFFSDPRLFSVVCAVMCDALYDHLHSEGLLDLPAHWRQAEEAEPAAS